MQEYETDVLVVGAGPVGLTLAMDLAPEPLPAQFGDALFLPTPELLGGAARLS